LLHDCDLVADFSVVIGDVSRTQRHYANNIAKAIRYSPAHARYVFISTINAFGMSEQFNKARRYLIPHSIYAVTKRFGEAVTQRYGRKHGKDVYSFRLGHVHGLLQRVSQETDMLVNGRHTRFEYPDTPSYTVFCFTIAEGLVHIVEGKEKPGTYTLVSSPAWSWREVLEHYLSPGRRIEVSLVGRHHTPWFRRLPALLRRGVLGFLTRYKDTLRANVLHHFPTLEKKYKASLYVQRAKSQTAAYADTFVYRPEGVHEGVFPGPRLRYSTDSRVTMQTKTKEVAQQLTMLLPPSLAEPGTAAVGSVRRPTVPNNELCAE
jgi:hypothetical protein